MTVIAESKMSNYPVKQESLNTAVLFLIFNRLDTTKEVFEAIRSAKPPRLYIAADGARENKQGETEIVASVRDFVMSHIDWECEVFTLFREENLGCKYAISKAIDWFFTYEEMGIILEDDCLPNSSFFHFCDEILERYKADERIFIVSGYNKQNYWNKDRYDYFYSHFGGIWGWATWKRAWLENDVEMPDIHQFIEGDNFTKLLGPKLGHKRQNGILKILNKNVDTWDFQWAYARHKNNALAIVPAKSLIENIGFGEDATHTLGENPDNVCAQEMNFPTKENNFIIPDRNYDELFIAEPTLVQRIINKLKRILSR